MEVAIDPSSIPIVHFSEKMKPCNVQCEEPNETARSCVYLKNGKLDFYELKLLLKNHMLIAQNIKPTNISDTLFNKQDLHTDPLEISPAYLDVIASVIQDSEESLYALANRVNDLLSPYGRDKSLSHKFESAIQKAIEQVATRVKCGLSKEVYMSIKNTSDKMPWIRTSCSIIPILRLPHPILDSFLISQISISIFVLQVMSDRFYPNLVVYSLVKLH